MEQALTLTDAVMHPIPLHERPDAASGPGSVAKKLKSSIVPEIAEPGEANRADDLDSCPPYTINALSGERQAPPKTEDGTDTEEIDTNLAMVYIRIHTGASLVSQSSNKVGDHATLQANSSDWSQDGEIAPGVINLSPLAPEAGLDGIKSHVLHSRLYTTAAAAETSSASSAVISQQLASRNWDEVYQNVLQKIQSCRMLQETASGGLSPTAPLLQNQQDQQQQQQPASAERTCESMLDAQASHLAAGALATAYTDMQAAHKATGAVAATHSEPEVTADSPAPQHLHSVPSVEREAAGPGSPHHTQPAPRACHPLAGTQEPSGQIEGLDTHSSNSSSSSSSTDLKTPVVLPLGAADLPVQAVLDELDSLLAKGDIRSSTTLRSALQTSGHPHPAQVHHGHDGLDRPADKAAGQLGSSSSTSTSARSSTPHSRCSSDHQSASRRGGSSRAVSNCGRSSAAGRSLRNLHRGVSSGHGGCDDGDDGDDADVQGDSIQRVEVEPQAEGDERTQCLPLTGVTDAADEPAAPPTHKDAACGHDLVSLPHKDAATSVNGLVAMQQQPQQESRTQDSQELTDSSKLTTEASKDSESEADMVADKVTADCMRPTESDPVYQVTPPRRTSSGLYSSATHSKAEHCSSMNKLHTLYARMLADPALQRMGSSKNGAKPSAGNSTNCSMQRPCQGKQHTRLAGQPGHTDIGMRSSLPVSLSAAVDQQMGGVRRCRSVSPCKKPSVGRALVSPAVLQQRRPLESLQHGSQYLQGCHPQRRMSLGYLPGAYEQPAASRYPHCAAAAGAEHPERGMTSGARQAETHSTGTWRVEAEIGGAGPPHQHNASGRHSRRVSQTLPETRISLSSLLAEDGLARDSCTQYRQQRPRSAPRAASSPRRHTVANCHLTGRKKDPYYDNLAGDSAAMPSPVYRSPPRGSGNHLPGMSTTSTRRVNSRSCTDQVFDASKVSGKTFTTPAVRHAVGTPSRRTSVHRASDTSLRTHDLPRAAAQGVFEVSGREDLGKYLHGLALQAAMDDLQQRATFSAGTTDAHACVLTLQSPPADSSQSDAREGHKASGMLAVLPTTQVLKTVPENGSMSSLTVSSTASMSGTLSSALASESGSVQQGGQTNQQGHHAAGWWPTSEQTSAAASAALAAGLEPACHADAQPPATGNDLMRTSSMQSCNLGSGRRLSMADHHCISTTGSMRSHGFPAVVSASSSTTSSRIWRPGGTRTSAKDDFRKLQTYETARLQARQQHELLSPGCSSRNLFHARSSSSTARQNSSAFEADPLVDPAAPSSAVNAEASPSNVDAASCSAAAAGRRPGSGTPHLPAAQVTTGLPLAAFAKTKLPNLDCCRTPRKLCGGQQQSQDDEAEDTSLNLPATPCKSPRHNQQRDAQPAKPTATASPTRHASSKQSPQQRQGQHFLQSARTGRSSYSSNSTAPQVEDAIQAAQAALSMRRKQLVVQDPRQKPLDRGYLTSSWGTASSNGRDCKASRGGKETPAQQANHRRLSLGVTGLLAPALATVQRDSGAAQQDELCTGTAAVRRHSYADSRVGRHQRMTLRASDTAALPAGAATGVPRVKNTSSTTRAGMQPAAAPSTLRQLQAAGRMRGAQAGKPLQSRTPARGGGSPARSPQRRPLSALEELLGLDPVLDDRHPLPPLRPGSAEPTGGEATQTAAAAGWSYRTPDGQLLQHKGKAALSCGSTGTRGEVPLQARGTQSHKKVVSPGDSSSSSSRESDQGSSRRDCSVNAVEPWCTPSHHHTAGVTVEEMLDMYRRRSTNVAVVDTAAQEGGGGASGAVAAVAAAAARNEPPFQLDLLLRAYTALNKKHSNGSDRTAAMTLLMDTIRQVNGPTTNPSLSGSPHTPQAPSALSADPASGVPPAAAPIAAPAHAIPSAAPHQPAGELSPGTEQQQQQHEMKLRSGPSPGAEGLCLDVLGKGLHPPDSPASVHAACLAPAGTCVPPSSPSSILQTLKADSKSSWHRVSPERQAAHATLLATPKHKHASSYAADLVALAAAASSSASPPPGQHSDKSVLRPDRADGLVDSSGSPAAAATATAATASCRAQGLSQSSPGTAVPAFSATQAQLAAPAACTQQDAGDGNMPASRACVPLLGARITAGGTPTPAAESPQELAALMRQQQQQALHSAPTQPRLMVDTATGCAVLNAIQAHKMTVLQAVTWLRLGLQSCEVSFNTPKVPDEHLLLRGSSPTARSRSTSPRRRHPTSRPCSPFNCFKGAASGSDEEGEEQEVGAPSRGPAGSTLPQQQQQQACDSGDSECVSFEMGADYQLVMVRRSYPGAPPASRNPVLGICLKQVGSGNSTAEHPGTPGHREACSPSHSPAGSSLVATTACCTSSLDLITQEGVHTIELASETDWAGLVVALNAMLLLREEGRDSQQRSDGWRALQSKSMQAVPWSQGVGGVPV